MNLRDFISSYWSNPPPDACVTIWSGRTKVSAHIPVTDVDTVAEWTEWLSDHDDNAYFGTCLRRPGLDKTVRGTKLDCVALASMWLDVDFAGPGHKRADLPNEDQALEIIDAAALEPTLVIHTGGGLHVHWLIDRCVTITPGDVARVSHVSKQFQTQIIDHARNNMGFHVDKTYPIDRVLRFPFTKNNKPGRPPTDVKIIYDDGPIYTWDEILQLPHVAAGLPGITSKGVIAPSVARSLQPDDVVIDEVIRKIRRISNRDNRRLMDDVLAGRPFAKTGERDSTLQRVCSIIAFIAPDADPTQLAEIVRPSLEAMEAESNDSANPPPTIEDAIDKIDRALDDAHRKRRQTQAIGRAFGLSPTGGSGASGATRNAAPSGGDTTGAETPPPPPMAAAGGGTGDINIPPYTPDDLDGFAASQGIPPSDFLNRWIIQHKTAYYVFRQGRYMAPVIEKALVTKVRDDLDPAGALGVDLFKATKDGSIRRLTPQELMDAYGTVARYAKASMVVKETYYDGTTETLWEAACPVRDIPVVFDPNVDQWLRLLGGTQADKLLDWVATVTRLDKQSSALYLSGHAGAGKTMLAHGLARLWTLGSPTELSDVSGDGFNEDLIRCPLVFGDEALSCSTATLRTLVGSSSRTLRRKYMPNVDLEGCLRLILADNAGKMLENGREEIGEKDREAVASKFLHISVSTEPVEFLKALGGPSKNGTGDWVDGDRIASHALWLSQHRTVSGTSRFLVEGESNTMTNLLSLQGKAASLTCEWIVRFLESPKKEIFHKNLAVVGSGSVLINVEAIYQYWELYIKSEARPLSRTRIGNGLRNISHGTVRRNNARFHDIRVDLLESWCIDNGVGDWDNISLTVSKP